MANNRSRRSFLLTAPVAAVAGLSLAESLFAAPDTAAAAPTAPVPFQFYTAKDIEAAEHALQASAVVDKKGGKMNNKDLANAKNLPLTFTLTTEETKIANTFEYHEGRDHIVQIVDGVTRYEVGGIPQNPRANGPGEWLADVCTGSTALTLRKGDTLTIPRGTPHKRMTDTSVTLTLVSTYGPVKS